MKTLVSTAGSGAPAAPAAPAGPETSDALAPGALAGPWRVEHELGRGGMGAVYAVVHEEIGKRAALKVVHRRLMPGFNCDRMLLEAKVVNQVGHPNIVDIFETGTLADGRPYIVMERLSGQSLAARADEGKLRSDLVIAILLQVCDALIAAHAAGIIHRDLKLDNVFLTDNPEDPTTPKVKLLDWGIAKVIHHDVKHTIEGQLMGTPQYLSPEQARGLDVTPQTDVYSLGVMSYELFLEQLPFEAETAAEVMAMHLRNVPPPPRELWPDVPPGLEALLLAMLDKQADRRPTMIEVAHRLEAVRGELDQRCVLRGGAPLASPLPRRTPSRPPVRPGSRLGSRPGSRLGSRPGSRPASRPSPRPPSRGGSSRGSKSGGAIASSGLAPTELFGWRSETRRWQYALGGLAIALGGVMFWISRTGDRDASAATAPALVAAPPAAGAVATPDPRSAAAEPMLDRVVPAAASADDTADVQLHTAALTRRDARNDRPAVTAPAGGTRRAGSRPAPPHSSPAAPRPRAALDPDGTLDVYR